MHSHFEPDQTAEGCRLIALFRSIPFPDLWRGLSQVDIRSMLRLTMSCRCMYTQLRSANQLWQQIYWHTYQPDMCYQEREFMLHSLRYYQRKQNATLPAPPNTGINESAPNTADTSTKRDSLAQPAASTDVDPSADWFSVLRQRYCTEQRWRRDQERHIVVRLLDPVNIGHWELETLSATGGIMYFRTMGASNLERHCIVENGPTEHRLEELPLPLSEDRSSQHYYMTSMRDLMRPANSKPRRYYSSSMLGESHIVTCTHDDSMHTTTLFIRDRATRTLQHQTLLAEAPYVKLVATRGVWALLQYFHHGQSGYTLMLWHLGRKVSAFDRLVSDDGLAYPQFSLCRLSDTAAYVYAVCSERPSGLKWSLYKFSLTEPTLKVASGQLCSSVSLIGCNAVYSIGTNYMAVECLGGTLGSHLVVHSLDACTENASLAPLMEPSYWGFAILPNGIAWIDRTYNICVLPDISSAPTTIHRLSIPNYTPCDCKHVIGSLILVEVRPIQNPDQESIVTMLFDTFTGNVLRTFDFGYLSASVRRNLYMVPVYMSSYMRTDSSRNELHIFDFSD